MSDEPTTEDNGPKELRDALTARTTERDAAVSELRTFQATTHFEKAGLGEKQADLFLKTNPEAEITAEAVGTFIDEYGFVTTPVDAPPAVEVPPVDAGLGALGGAAGTASSAPAAQPKMSKTDFAQLLVDNPQQAAEAYTKGQVERNPANVQARELVKKGIIDH